MEDWHLKKGDLKKYPHFDPPISVKEAEEYATDSARVARHAFYPFIVYLQRWTRFAKKGQEGIVKERPIRYAARRDAYVFSYYRHLLSLLYEKELARLGLSESVLAYRHIRTVSGEGGKCNIHFARDAILKIRELGDCCAIALDISGFFESLEHARLKDLWGRMLGVDKLPPDHFHVFEAITKYAVVDKENLYERLGHFGDERAKDTGKPTRGYITKYKQMPNRLCTGEEFRKTIAGGGGQKSIIKRHYKPYGVPQGAPISDLLANLYLLDFDTIVAGWVRESGGAYYRYSDDILVLAPGTETAGRELMERISELIRHFGAHLAIKKEKSSLFIYEKQGEDQKLRILHGSKGKNGIEYLGFRYDGKRVYLRDSTIANLRRKVARAAYYQADACARRYPDKDAARLKAIFNYEQFIKQFGRVEDFGEKHEDYRNWTFWTYAKRASERFGVLGKPILRQLRKHSALIRWRIGKELEGAVVRRKRRQAQP